jgi:hypothetical protein
MTQNDLTSKEKKMLENYNKLNTENKKKIIVFMESLYNSDIEVKYRMAHNAALPTE